MDVQHCLNDWLIGFGNKQRKKIAVGVAAIFWGLWKTRNLACFENKWPVEPIEVIHKVCYWTDLWANLQAWEGVKMELQVGTRLLVRVADEAFRGARSWASWRPRLGG